MTTLKQRLEKLDRTPETMRNASKEAWECGSYAEWLASLPADEQPEACDDEE